MVRSRIRIGHAAPHHPIACSAYDMDAGTRRSPIDRAIVNRTIDAVQQGEAAAYLHRWLLWRKPRIIWHSSPNLIEHLARPSNANGPEHTVLEMRIKHSNQTDLRHRVGKLKKAFLDVARDGNKTAFRKPGV